MTNPLVAYRLRMQLVERGHVPCPIRDGKPVYIPHSMPSEPAVRSWATLHENAYETRIVDLQTHSVTPVTVVPMGSPVTEVPTANQRRKEAKRRSQGVMPRTEWLKARSAKPWVGAGVSRATWYRQKHERETGVAGSRNSSRKSSSNE